MSERCNEVLVRRLEFLEVSLRALLVPQHSLGVTRGRTLGQAHKVVGSVRKISVLIDVFHRMGLIYCQFCPVQGRI
jgi:hypothetical protein